MRKIRKARSKYAKAVFTAYWMAQSDKAFHKMQKLEKMQRNELKRQQRLERREMMAPVNTKIEPDASAEPAESQLEQPAE